MEVVFVHAVVDQRESNECLSGTQDLIVGLQLDTFMRGTRKIIFDLLMSDGRQLPVPRVFFS